MTMLERVARAQAMGFGLDWEKMSERPFNEGVTDHLCRAFWCEIARDALAAMRDLPHEVLAADWIQSQAETTDRIKAIWSECIDAILKEQP